MSKRNPPKSITPVDNPALEKELALMTSELRAGFKQLSTIPPAVSILGSARIEQGSPIYQQTYELAQKLSDAGISVVSGGGSGVMEAANRGAFSGENGLSIGLKSTLPAYKQASCPLAPYQDITLDFAYLFTRKTVFMKYPAACVVMPGGLGTFDELFEALALVRRYDYPDIPIILVGRFFWGGLLDWLKNTVISAGMMSEREFKLIQWVDTVDEAFEIIQAAVKENQ